LQDSNLVECAAHEHNSAESKTRRYGRMRKAIGVTMPSKTPQYNLCRVTLNILGYHENREWVALALEMDLRGYGKSFDEALKDLQNLVEMQIGFALFKGQPEMILRPADPIWFERFAESRKSCLTEMLTASHHSTQGKYEVASLPIPPAHVIAALQDKFMLADA
jgi:hypothetical protein